MISVAIIVFSGVQSLDVSGPMDVFSEANRFLSPDSRYRLTTIGIEGTLLKCSNGMAIVADHHWREIDRVFDLLLVAGGPDIPNLAHDEEFHGWLRSVSDKAARFGSICNGVFILGRAGLLDGRTVTTHWDDAGALVAACPCTKVEADRIYVQDGRLYTSAGVTAGIDLALHLLRQDHGRGLTLSVAKRLIVFTQRSGDQSQFSPYLTAYADATSPIARVQRHVLGHLRDTLSVKELAEIADMSARNFARTFLRELGMTPAEFVQRTRVDAARTMLENSDAPLKSIAYECGFNNSGRLRSAFMNCLQVTPQQYRANFGS